MLTYLRSIKDRDNWNQLAEILEKKAGVISYKNNTWENPHYRFPLPIWYRALKLFGYNV